MSRNYSAIKNKQQKRSKVHFAQYLDNVREPNDDSFYDSLLAEEVELLEDSFFMRRHFRNIAKRLRNH